MTRGNQRERDRYDSIPSNFPEHHRERAMNRNAASTPQSQLAANAKALSVLCSICRQSFMCMCTTRTHTELTIRIGTQSRAQLQVHVDAKHPKSTFEACFPGSEAK